MAKKILVSNSPWGREYERPSDCERWVKQGHGAIISGIFSFTEKFVAAVIRADAEADPERFEDGYTILGVQSYDRYATAQCCDLRTRVVVRVPCEEIDRTKIPVRMAGGHKVIQRIPVESRRTNGSHHTPRQDKLIRRQTRRDPGRSVERIS